MIFKSLGRKTASFSDLYDYISREGKPVGDGIAWNLSTFDVRDRDRILSDFYENARCLSKRKNGNVLYHEILSLPRSPEDDLETLHQAVHDMAVYWLEARAPGQLACGRVHLEEHNIHIHLMISSNGIGEDRTTLSRFQFATIERDCEAYLAQRYPRLCRRMLHQKTPGPNRKIPLADRVTLILSSILDEKITHRTPPIGQRIKAAGFELHLRGSTSHSVSLPSGKRYRLRKLNLLERLLEVLETEKAIADRKNELRRHLERVRPGPGPGCDLHPEPALSPNHNPSP